MTKPTLDKVLDRMLTNFNLSAGLCGTKDVENLIAALRKCRRQRDHYSKIAYEAHDAVGYEQSAIGRADAELLKIVEGEGG